MGVDQQQSMGIKFIMFSLKGKSLLGKYLLGYVRCFLKGF